MHLIVHSVDGCKICVYNFKDCKIDLMNIIFNLCRL